MKIAYESYVSSGQSNRTSEADAHSRALIKYISKKLPKRGSNQARLLDLGCGAGRLLAAGDSVGYDVSGVEISREQIALAPGSVRDKIAHDDIREWVERNKHSRFDVICLIDVLEHFYGEEALQILMKVRTLLNEGGFVVIHVPNGESPFFGKTFFGDITHKLAYTENSIQQIARLAGFDFIEACEDLFPCNFSGRARSVLWSVVRLVFLMFAFVESGSRRGLFTRNILARLA